MKMINIKHLLLPFIIVISIGCETNNPQSNDEFDRTLMLAHWADDIIIPGYRDYSNATNDMHNSVIAFLESPSATSLSSMREYWLHAYTSYQKVGMFLFGPDQTYNVINRTNIYPSDTASIIEHANNGDYNFDMPSTYAAQGFPAIEYLINSKSDDQVISFYTNQQDHYLHLLELSNVIKTNAELMYLDWVNSYRETFVSLDGSSATSSVNTLTNKYIEYIDRHIRANKIAIPAGVFSSDNPFPDKVEGRYTSNISKHLFLTGLDAFQYFFNGVTEDDSVGLGYSKYLEYLDNQAIATDINNQLNVARNLVETMSEDFEQQVINDNVKMLQLSDELQKAIVILKIDMMQALNIKLTYVDADGD